MKKPNKIKAFDPFETAEQKIQFLSTGTVFICLIIFALTLSAIYSKSLIELNNRELDTQMEVLTDIATHLKDKGESFIENSMNGPNNASNANNGDRHEKFGPPHFEKNTILVLYKNKELVEMQLNPFFTMDSPPPLNLNEQDAVISFTEENHYFRSIIHSDGDEIYQLVMNVDMEINAIHTLNQTLLITFCLLLLLAAAASRYLTRKLMIPIKTAYSDQVQFIQDASHEMRTPLAVIKSAIELMLRSPEKRIDENSTQVAQMLGEIRHLEKLNHNLLSLSKEVLSTPMDISSVKLSEFFTRLVSYYEDLAEHEEKHFKFEMSAPMPSAFWDSLKIQRSITILLENAFKYTEAGDTISLTVKSDNNLLYVTIADTGIGISETELPLIFSRFFRSPNVRARNIEGSGIGLSLLRAIAKPMKIKIKVQSQLEIGTTFDLQIPLDMRS